MLFLRKSLQQTHAVGPILLHIVLRTEAIERLGHLYTDQVTTFWVKAKPDYSRFHVIFSFPEK